MNTLHLILLWRIGCLLAAWLLGAGAAAWAQQRGDVKPSPPPPAQRSPLFRFRSPAPPGLPPSASPAGTFWFPTDPPQLISPPPQRLAFEFAPGLRVQPRPNVIIPNPNDPRWRARPREWRKRQEDLRNRLRERRFSPEPQQK